MRNPETHEAFRPEDAIDKRVADALKANGVIGRPQRGRVSIAPSLIINREEIDTLVDLVDDAITHVEHDLGMS
jgi:adenosylmethionine-8-amino-7-oxononanoate aminotransferase